MVLWDRIKKNMDGGIDKVMRVSKVISERTRIEASVARLLIDKGSLEIKEERAYKKLGERVYFLWEQKSHGVMKDQDVLQALQEITGVREDIASIKLTIQKISLGEEEA
jgi:G:T-mismatch repair DNA endonuclease (very short patch repair protein)